VEEYLKVCFLCGLNPEISKERIFEELESRAIYIERELEIVKMIRQIVLWKIQIVYLEKNV